MHDIQVDVKTQYLEEQSRPEQSKFVYAYGIRITNHSEETVQLTSQYWRIIDDKNREQEVQGLGVVGQQPYIPPGESYSYTSGAVLETPSGMMSGHYVMQRENGDTFEAEIPAFALVQPHAVH